MAKDTPKPAPEGTVVGTTTTVNIGDGRVRPVIITSVNSDGTVNGRLVSEPGDNPTNDGNFQTFYRNLKA